ncbi:MAG: apolipoprotein N-acyltransferase [Myxococcota bacterium]
MRALWGTAFALLLLLCFPFRAGTLRFDVGAVVGWLALVPLIRMTRGLHAREAFRWTLTAATAGYSGVLYWIYVVVHVHGHGAAPVALLAVGLLALYMGLHAALAAALWVGLAPWAGRLRFLLLPTAWVAAEHLRGFDLFGGFPWAYLGYAMHADGPVLELASLAGVHGLSFLLACVALLVADRRLVPALGLVAVVHAAGFGLRLASPVERNEEGSRAAIVQANIAQSEKWDPARTREGFERHLSLSRLAAASGRSDLIVWPETALPLALEYERAYAESVLELSRETGAVVVLGGMGLRRLPPGERGPDGLDFQVFNSVFVATPEGGFVDRYDKSHLVPFGEYVPARPLLGFLSAVAGGMTPGDVTPGSGPRPLRSSDGWPGGHAPAALICYEVIYPALVRDAVLGGARLLLNLTNDAWYGSTSAPHQFLAIAATRSAEHGIPMLRAANTGISAIVDAGGVVLRETPIFEAHALHGRIPGARARRTLYTCAGDWIVGLSWALLIGVGGAGLANGIRRNQRSHPGDPDGARSSRCASFRASEASLTSTGSERS